MLTVRKGLSVTRVLLDILIVLGGKLAAGQRRPDPAVVARSWPGSYRPSALDFGTMRCFRTLAESVSSSSSTRMDGAGDCGVAGVATVHRGGDRPVVAARRRAALGMTATSLLLGGADPPASDPARSSATSASLGEPGRLVRGGET